MRPREKARGLESTNVKPKLPKLGTRVHVEWIDICGYVNVPLSCAQTVQCWSEGLIIKNTKDHIVLASSQYRGEGDDPVGDYTAIPKGVIVKVKKIPG